VDRKAYKLKCWACVKPLEVVIADRLEVGPPKPERKLPTNDEERAEAYFSALARLEAFFKTQGFESYVSDGGTLMVGKGSFLLDAKIVPNDGRTAYVTSGPKYDPTKAGKKDSGATVITSRTVMKASNLLRVTVSSRMTGRPIFVELRKNIADPEAHICKSVLFVLQDALNSRSVLGREIRDVSALKDVPAEWMPRPGDYDQLFGLPQDEIPMLEPPR
jgi:hypothetical protein